ncbi:hypothetical protein FHS89_001395 [Rubricella aquisinus]|uniref:Uncharacterized protein n=2 Tax=Rubricella aquisinus TaxID=2028108 RepID=A0A840WMR3_9RHOB|nr:hypothetical protein [Rubricella aquisinus]
MDKTTRIARQMIEDQVKQEKAKTDRLRTARLERDASTAAKPAS